jgi:hypothetical protein
MRKIAAGPEMRYCLVESLDREELVGALVAVRALDSAELVAALVPWTEPPRLELDGEIAARTFGLSSTEIGASCGESEISVGGGDVGGGSAVPSLPWKSEGVSVSIAPSPVTPVPSDEGERRESRAGVALLEG